jgi:hypothetical protein
MRAILAACVVAGLAAIVAVSLTPALPANAQTGTDAANEPAAPSISDIMAQQQRRHIKLWFAGRGGNWPLADYEIDALKGGFEDVNNLLGGDTVKDAVEAPIAALAKAIEAKDRAAFTGAYDKLTAGCNSCHHALDHAFIVIQRPSVLPYSDQSFAPPK